MSSAFDILISKLNNFIRRYYKNLIIKGAILSITLIAVLFLIISLFEHLSWSDTITRTIIFYLFLTAVFVILVYFVIIPALKIIKLGKMISHEDAAMIIGIHFPEVSDKLLNTLQLHNKATDSNMELLLASIEQKSEALSPVPFKSAIKYRTNIRYIKFLAPPLAILLVILIISPGFIFNPTDRIINHSTEFAKPLPYTIELLNSNFTCAQHNNYSIKLRLIGDEIPNKVWVVENGYNYYMQEINPGIFEYVFKDVLSDKYFSIATDEFTSSKYHLEVYPQPVIFNFSVLLDYPKYLNKQADIIENTGDLIVPEGTKLSWSIFTRDTRNVHFIIKDSISILQYKESNVFKHNLIASSNFNYSLSSDNSYMVSNDTMSFNVQVIKDEYPIITANEFKDENNYGLINFTGTISDDHGFSSLYFYYRKDTIPESGWKKNKLIIDNSISQQHFDYMLFAMDYGLLPGDALHYYFEVRDNDGVNWYKRSKSEMYSFQLPDAEEIENKIENSSNQMKSKLNESIKEINALDKQLDETRLNLFEKKDLSWADKQQLSDLLKKEEDIKNKLDEIKKLNEDIKELEELLKDKLSPDLVEKLKQLEELFNDLFNKDLEKEIEKLKEELEKEKVGDFLDKMKQQNEDLKDELEQNLELYKQLEFERLIEESIEELNKLAKEEKELSNQTKNKENSKDEAKEKQSDIQNKFDELMKDLDNADELNKELEDPYKMEIDTAMSTEINKQMEDAQENISKGKKNKASENQKNAGDKMQKMANGLSMMMQSEMEERMGEDVDQIKNMLDNLLDLSFAQESLIKTLHITSKNDPKNAEIRDQQVDLKDDFMIINDSLSAMGKRQAAIKPFIIKESGKIVAHIENALSQLQEQKKGPASSEQQYAMTSMNNLSLMLSESLEQMKKAMQMSSSKKGGSKCKNPGKGKSPSMSEILNQQKGMSEGLKGKAKKNGLDGENGLNKKSEELARMAAAQSEIRRMLQEFIEQLEGEGGNGSALNKVVEEMKKTEDDVVNRRVTMETIERQKNIETRLLKSQKALQEREKEKKRESKEGKNRKSSNLNNKIEYKPTKDIQEEILITTPIEVAPYYKKLLKEYLYKLEKENKDGK